MRIDLKKIFFIGLKTDQTNFFSQVQELGIVHFIDLKQKISKAMPKELESNSQAIKILRQLPSQPQEIFQEDFSADHLITDILACRQRQEAIGEELRILDLEIKRIAPLGDFSFEDVRRLEKESKRTIQFFFTKTSNCQKELPECLYLASENGFDYFMSISCKKQQFAKMEELIISDSLHRLKEKHIQLQLESDKLALRHQESSKYITYLQHVLSRKLDKHSQHSAENAVELILDDVLFVISGWVPENKVDQLGLLSQHMHIHMEEVPIGEEDAVPTYLQNQGISRIGEDLINIYDSPSKTDADPSLWVLFFFALFFAMIVGDGGYGFFLLLIGFYIRHTYKEMTGMGKRMLNLLFILSGSVIIWGLLTVSFFGINIAPDNALRKISPLSWLVESKTAYHFEQSDSIAREWMRKFPDLQEMHSPIEFLKSAVTVNPDSGRVSYEMYNTFADNLLLELAVLVGIVHLISSLLRYANRHMAAFGWVAFIVGGYLYCPPFLEANSIAQFVFGVSGEVASKCGLILMGSGVAFALFFNFFQRGIASAIEGLTLIVQIFSDSMSYLRLYALGLSGALITSTINELVDGMPIFFVAIILTATHVVNFLMAIMGATIHGLRLNFLEWYHYSFEGGGKRFEPLRKLEIE